MIWLWLSEGQCTSDAACLERFRGKIEIVLGKQSKLQEDQDGEYLGVDHFDTITENQCYPQLYQNYIKLAQQMQPESPSDDPLTPYYTHPDSQLLKLSIRQSSIPQAGMGLFATQHFQPNEIIVEYYGSIIRSCHAYDPPFTNEDKMVQIDEEFSVISRGPCSRVNDIVQWDPSIATSPLFGIFKKRRSFPTHANVSHNAHLQTLDKQKAFIVATRHIAPGQQIFISYGFDYWLFFYELLRK